jgi:hypothetical protein
LISLWVGNWSFHKYGRGLEAGDSDGLLHVDSESGKILYVVAQFSNRHSKVLLESKLAN